MENATESIPQTSPVATEAEIEKKASESTRQIVQMLNTIQYLLTAGTYQGKDASMVVVSTQFCIDFKKHLEAENKKKEVIEKSA